MVNINIEAKDKVKRLPMRALASENGSIATSGASNLRSLTQET